ncbi:hypothetical protein EYC80_005151 [Monilinia laxa]|uniref:Uncharacterized protein n=1 Tax=Monilinia laxa TaxID=61186 RepID=A0A5N6KJ05_MONLA|nr:hypothetical protein EYC80_005151 [Monilinia laxa]
MASMTDTLGTFYDAGIVPELVGLNLSTPFYPSRVNSQINHLRRWHNLWHITYFERAATSEDAAVMLDS